MSNGNKFTFEEIVNQNEKRIHYYIYQLKIRDNNEDFYSEGLFALWNAYETYEPNKGPMGTYFNFTIKNRLIDQIRKEVQAQEKLKHYTLKNKFQFNDGNYLSGLASNKPILGSKDITLGNDELWDQLETNLTNKQWKWVNYYILNDMSVKEIAEKEGVTVEAVKSWGKETRKKLRDPDFREKIGWIIDDYS
ncbi:sigma-70 family RNA polymerase sigma factor [Oceanobacillus polygoni]|uniref:RNA polymerase sigma factor (Sigma-70 family) n=1 Tax=Oceanobacillus polygoni TaxID=1235259 RepID=A0A9X0YSC5_9BACI|nr:RNA polymerase sigma factor (sigma-70 family) [Oceanobacillus polygoni]